MSGIFQIGSYCGEWKILQYLNGSGQSEIYLAERMDMHGRRTLGAIRTIKFIDRNGNPLSQDDIQQVMRAMAHESDILHKFHSDHIADQYDSGIRPHFWIATQYIEGQSLQERLEKRGPLTQIEWTEFAKDALRGLKHAHARGFVHQDIKPGNIMIQESDGKAIWIDFGSASAIGKEDSGYNGQASTFVYTAPERIAGHTRGNAASDLYSLGVMLYQAATGRLPWKPPAGNPSLEQFQQSVFEQMVSGNPDFSKLTNDQAILISSLISPDPKQRPTADKALKMLGAAASEINGGTVYEPSVVGAPAAKLPPRQPAKPSARPPRKAAPRKDAPAQGSAGPKVPGNLRGWYLTTLWLTFGLYTPAVTWVSFKRFRNVSVVLPLTQTLLVLTTVAISGSAPRVIIDGESTLNMVASNVIGFLVLANLLLGIYAYKKRPRDPSKNRN